MNYLLTKWNPFAAKPVQPVAADEKKSEIAPQKKEDVAAASLSASPALDASVCAQAIVQCRTAKEEEEETAKLREQVETLSVAVEKGVDLKNSIIVVNDALTEEIRAHHSKFETLTAAKLAAEQKLAMLDAQIIQDREALEKAKSALKAQEDRWLAATAEKQRLLRVANQKIAAEKETLKEKEEAVAVAAATASAAIPPPPLSSSSSATTDQ